MWSNEDTTHPFMFPPMPFDLKPQNFENGHRSRGRGRMRGNYNRSPGGYPRVNSEANAQFYCDTCNRAFADGQSLSEHLAQHKTCSWDGCTFEAHYKMVELHVKMQHETGLADKIMMLNTPEEIEKWKNERKRNYPTAVNVARRQAEQAKQAERGELIPNKEFGKFRRNRGRPFDRSGSTRGRGRGREMTDGVDATRDQFVARGRGGQSRRKRRRPCGNNNNNNNNNNNKDNNGLPTVSNDYFGWDEEDSLKRFEGTVTAAPEAGQSRRLHEENPEGDLITDSEGETMTETEKASVQGPNANVPKALENLLTAYPSDSEEETSNREPNAKVAKPREEHRPKTWNRPQFQIQKRSTLLEMLLSKEIQQERNQIFQCVRYIVQNEFFGIGREKVEGLEETFEEEPDECKRFTDNLCTKTPSDV